MENTNDDQRAQDIADCFRPLAALSRRTTIALKVSVMRSQRPMSLLDAADNLDDYFAAIGTARTNAGLDRLLSAIVAEEIDAPAEVTIV